MCSQIYDERFLDDFCIGKRQHKEKKIHCTNLHFTGSQRFPNI